MTDPQGQPDHESAAAPEPPVPAAAEPGTPTVPTPPAEPAAADQPAEPPVKKAPAKAPKKAPAKAAKKAPAKAAKKAPAKKAPEKKAPAAPAAVPDPAPRPAATNGSGRLADGAKETAAQAKSTVEAAPNPLSPSVSSSGRSPGAVLAAGVLGLVGLLLLRRLFRARRG